MIVGDQPTIFDDRIIAAVSSAEDGTMKLNGEDAETVLQNRKAFLDKAGIAPEQTTLVQVVYDNAEHFARYHIVADEHRSEGMFEPNSRIVADALVVRRPGHALFLPLADCAGLILHDPTKELLMVSHVGRHSAEIDGAKTSVDYLKSYFDTNPADLRIWVSPAVGKKTYPLHAKDGKGLRDVIAEQLKEAGVPSENIEFSPVDTAESSDYFSHSQFLAGNRDTNGRFAIVAMMAVQGEPAI